MLRTAWTDEWERADTPDPLKEKILKLNSVTGTEPITDKVKELAKDTAIQAADTLMLTVPNQLGVEYNAHAMESILKYVAPDLGWR